MYIYNTKRYSLKKYHFKKNIIKESDIPVHCEILEILDGFLFQIIISSTIVMILFDFITLKISYCKRILRISQ